MALWLVRAGKHGEYEERFLADGRIYLTWQGGLQQVDLSGASDRAAIRAAVEQAYPEAPEKRVVSGSALFTEVNVLLPELFLNRRGPRLRLLRFWLIVYLGNLAGAIFVGFMLNAADVIGPAQGQRLAEIIGEKMRFEQMGAEGWIRVVASGILANWLVGMAAFLASAARTVSGKILGILLPILAFVALGVQHVPANMGYFAAALIHGNAGTTAAEAFFWNLLPATIGNLIGGTVLVALLFWYTYGGNSRGQGALERANELVHAHVSEADR